MWKTFAWLLPEDRKNGSDDNERHVTKVMAERRTSQRWEEKRNLPDAFMTTCGHTKVTIVAGFVKNFAGREFDKVTKNE